MPWWVLPAAAVAQAAAAFLVAFALGAFLFRLARRAHRRNAPWPERARALYPPRAALLQASWAVPISIAILLPAFAGGLLGGAPVVVLSAAAGAAAGFVLWRRRLARLVRGHRWTIRRGLAGIATRTLVLYPHLWAALALTLAMPSRLDVRTALLLVAAVAALAWLATSGGFRIARALGLAPPAPPEIAQAVEAAAARAGIPLAGVHQIDLPEANACARPSLARISFTRAALQKLDRASLLAVARHELMHLSEPVRARRTRTAGVLVLAPLMLMKPLSAAGGLTAVLLGALLALLIGMLLHKSLAALETRADAGAGDSEPEKGTFARALTELHRLNLIPVVLRGTVHPHLYDRLVALGAPPAYPRPRPPSRAIGLALVGLVVACALVLAWWGGVAAVLCDDPWAAVALDGGGAQSAGDLALARHAAGRYDEAATFYGAAAVLDPWSPHWPAYRAMSLAAAGRIEEAERALADAERLGLEADQVAETRERIGRAR